MTLPDAWAEALKGSARPPDRRTGRRVRRFGWRQILAQVLCIAAVTAFVVALLLYTEGDL